MKTSLLSHSFEDDLVVAPCYVLPTTSMALAYVGLLKTLQGWHGCGPRSSSSSPLPLCRICLQAYTSVSVLNGIPHAQEVWFTPFASMRRCCKMPTLDSNPWEGYTCCALSILHTGAAQAPMQQPCQLSLQCRSPTAAMACIGDRYNSKVEDIHRFLEVVPSQKI